MLKRFVALSYRGMHSSFGGFLPRVGGRMFSSLSEKPENGPVKLPEPDPAWYAQTNILHVDLYHRAELSRLGEKIERESTAVKNEVQKLDDKTAKEFSSVRSDIKEVRSEVQKLDDKTAKEFSSVRSDIKEVRSEIQKLDDKTAKEFASVRSDIKDVRGEIQKLDDKTAKEFASVRSDIKDVRSEVQNLDDKTAKEFKVLESKLDMLAESVSKGQIELTDKVLSGQKEIALTMGHNNIAMFAVMLTVVGGGVFANQHFNERRERERGSSLATSSSSNLPKL